MRWVDSNEMGIKEAGWGGMVWNDLAHDIDRWRTILNMVTNLSLSASVV
jgi:hypothetical protein